MYLMKIQNFLQYFDVVNFWLKVCKVISAVQCDVLSVAIATVDLWLLWMNMKTNKHQTVAMLALLPTHDLPSVAAMQCLFTDLTRSLISSSNTSASVW
jgi:hypothetical protein